MKNHEKDFLRSRRDFIRQAACASLGVTGLVNALAHMRLMTAAIAQSSQTEDYKALVYLFLNGGNDSNNMIVPIGLPTASIARADYERGRGIIGLASNTLHPILVPSTSRAFNLHYGGVNQPLGFHPHCEALANLFNTGKMSVVANVGTLAHPIGSRLAYNSGKIPLPSQLFSHSDQQTQWQSSLPDKPFANGWGGRATDLLHSSYNAGDSKVSMNISLAGVNSFQVGTNGEQVQYVVEPSGTVNLESYNTNYSDALNPDGSYKTTDDGKRFKAFEDVMRLTHDNLHEEQHNRIMLRARKTEGIIGAAMTAAAATGTDFDAIFTAADANHRLGDQLKMIAKLIAGRNLLGNKRQIFFCQVAGYDTHADTLASHGNLMTELSTGIKAFHDTLTAPTMNVWDKVVTFTASDFNRTFTPNGIDSSAGCDHAWGGHALVMGGPVRGGDIYGSFPLLKLGDVAGSLDAGSGSTNRGRWVPTTSVDQYCSILTSWLGANRTELETIFPNLGRFDDPSIAAANLGFL